LARARGAEARFRGFSTATLGLIVTPMSMLHHIRAIALESLALLRGL